ncbi:MAG: hypothetical protein ACKVON_08115 [Beijerinckiaceae bacterium]
MTRTQEAAVAVLQEQMQRVQTDIQDHAAEAKETAAKASIERKQIFDKLDEISRALATKDAATNGRIDAWENKGAGAKWMAAVGITVISTLAGAAGAAATFFLKYGSALPR